MKLSKNVRLEVRALLTFLCGAWIGPLMLYVAYEMGLFLTAPALYVEAMSVFLVIVGYLWWRKGMSPDKSKFKTPPLW